VADPLDGLAYDNIIEVKPIVDKFQEMTIETQSGFLCFLENLIQEY